jgi:hypothetical protein
MAFAVTPADLHALTSPDAGDTGATQRAVEQLQHLTTLVEVRWDELDESSRTTLLAFSYGAIAAPVNLRDKGFAAIGRTWQAVSTAAGGETERAFVALTEQLFALVNAVLDRVERADPRYGQFAQDALRDVFFEPAEPLPTTREGKLAYLRRISS